MADGEAEHPKREIGSDQQIAKKRRTSVTSESVLSVLDFFALDNSLRLDHHG